METQPPTPSHPSKSPSYAAVPPPYASVQKTPPSAYGLRRTSSERRKHPPTSLYIGGPDDKELEDYVRAKEKTAYGGHGGAYEDYSEELGHLRKDIHDKINCTAFWGENFFILDSRIRKSPCLIYKIVQKQPF